MTTKTLILVGLMAAIIVILGVSVRLLWLQKEEAINQTHEFKDALQTQIDAFNAMSDYAAKLELKQREHLEMRKAVEHAIVTDPQIQDWCDIPLPDDLRQLLDGNCTEN